MTRDWEEPTGSVVPALGPAPGLPGLHDLGEAMRFLRAETPRIGASALVGLALAVGVWSILPSQFTATALILVDPRTAKVTSTDDVLPGIGGDSAAIASIVEVAMSDGALTPLVKEQKLADDPEFAGRGLFGGAPSETDVVAAVRKAVRVTRRGLTYVIEVAATVKSAEKAARLANALAKDIVDRQSATRTNASTNAAGALENRLSDLRTAALASERAVSDYRMQRGLLDVTADATVGQRRLASLAQQSASVRSRLEEAKARYDELRRMKPQDIGGGTTTPRSELLVTLRGQLADERRQAAELARIYGPRHPRVETSDERVTTIEEQIRAETTRLVEQAKSEVDQLQKQNTGLEAELSKRTNAELAMTQDEVELRELIRQAEADRQIYEQFLGRQKAAQEQSSLTRPETEVVSQALPPTRSNKPSLALVGPVGLALGAMAGIALSVLRRRQRGPSRSETAEAPIAPLAAEPIVAPTPAEPPNTVPRGRRAAAVSEAPEPPPATRVAAALARPRPARRTRPTARPDPNLIFEELGTPVVADLPRLSAPRIGRGTDVDLGVVDARSAMIPFAETFFQHLKTNPGQTLMVTNVPGAVGRTTMALAIGRMAEAVGLTALVVTDHGDARDVRPSLADLLAGRRSLADQPPPETVDGVSVMGFGGEGDDDFWDVAEDGRLPALMARLTREWDLVVIEGSAPEAANREVVPPLEVVRSVLLVVDREGNTMDDVTENVGLWADGGARLVMVGLNRAA